ncbi:MAG: hypothetical protein ACREJV_08710 [Candidatus Rokuibacteriota bacterium]
MKRPLGILLLTVAVLLGLELALPSTGHGPPGAPAAFGLIGCVLIVGFAKGLGGLGLQRGETADE